MLVIILGEHQQESLRLLAWEENAKAIALRRISIWITQAPPRCKVDEVYYFAGETITPAKRLQHKLPVYLRLPARSLRYETCTMSIGI